MEFAVKMKCISAYLGKVAASESAEKGKLKRARVGKSADKYRMLRPKINLIDKNKKFKERAAA